MTLYTRQQLVLLLLVVAAAGVGLAAGQVRRAYPDAVEALEALDRAPAAGVPQRAAARTARAASRPPAPLDLNRAALEDLARLPGIGRGLAARIVAARETGGPFASVEELRRVRGLPRRTLERVRPLVTTAP